MEQQQIRYTSFRLREAEILGYGSYGIVYKAEYDDLICAAKTIHRQLSDENARQQLGQQHRDPISRFERECEFMMAIRHPNIVQCLGIERHPHTGQPVLLTELMDGNLTTFLETSQSPVPYRIQVNFCHDISLALSFLHSNNIVHRDLSSNNVLLIGTIKAKVSDFGMAKVYGPLSNQASMTTTPGADVYMPPEAVRHQPVYAEKIDSFSFGVITLQILTRKNPNPSDRYKPVSEHSSLRTIVSEYERRQDHISEVDQDHPLLNILLNCLLDNASDRLSSHQLCQRFKELKGEPRYSQNEVESLPAPAPRASNSRQSSIVHEQERQISELQGQVEDLRQQLEQTTQLSEKDEVLNGKENMVLENIPSSVTADTELQNHEYIEHQTPLLVNFDQPHHIPLPTVQPAPSQVRVAKDFEDEKRELELKWKKCKFSPYSISRENCTFAFCNGKAYFNNKDTRDIYIYNPEDDSWSEHLPKCLYKKCTLAVLKGSLTTVGGMDNDDQATNEILFLGSNNRWKSCPPMPTKRYNAIVVWNDSVLIVAGGILTHVHYSQSKFAMVYSCVSFEKRPRSNNS